MCSKKSSSLFLFSLLFSLFTLSGCDFTNPEIPVKEHELNLTLAVEAITLVNNTRTTDRQCGYQEYKSTTTLKWNGQLAEAALAHSRDMASRDFFDHTNPNDEGPGVRIDRAGYSWRTYGENIAAGQANVTIAINGWINSPGHCANIMNGTFTEFAVASAVSENSSYGIYWTMVLAAPR